MSGAQMGSWKPDTWSWGMGADLGSIKGLLTSQKWRDGK